MRSEAEYVSCFGSGTIREEMHSYYNSPYAVETTHIKFRNSDLSAHIYRSLFDVARQYRESFEVYGSKQSVEWPLIEGRPLVVHTPSALSPRYPPKRKALITRTCCPSLSALSRSRASMMQTITSIFPSHRAAATAARIRTSCAPSWMR